MSSEGAPKRNFLVSAVQGKGAHADALTGMKVVIEVVL